MVSTSGSYKHDWPADHLYPSEPLLRSGTTGPWDSREIGALPAGINPGRVERWGVDNFQIFPNLEILIYERGWYLAYQCWPTSYNTHVFEGELCFVPAKPRASGWHTNTPPGRVQGLRACKTPEHSTARSWGSSHAHAPHSRSTTRRSSSVTSTRRWVTGCRRAHQGDGATV